MQMLFFVFEGDMTIEQLIHQTLEEDIGYGDITTQFLELEIQTQSAFIIAKADGVLAGVEVASLVFRMIDPSNRITIYKKDGDLVRYGNEIMRIEGNATAILTAERTALNFLQRLSGIATQTRRMVNLISNTGTKLLDTRKTTPLMRRLEKQAVRIGGAYNHRMGLYDMVMLKENHIHAVGSISEAVQRIKAKNTTYKIEVEVTNLDELEEAVSAGVDRVMLDNMDIAQIKTAVKKFGKRVELEVSGGVNEENILRYAKTGVHFISCGALTHSVKALDISLLFKE